MFQGGSRAHLDEHAQGLGGADLSQTDLYGDCLHEVNPTQARLSKARPGARGALVRDPMPTNCATRLLKS